MLRQSTTIVPIKGMNLDISPSKIDNLTVYKMLNMRLLPNLDNSLYSIVNEKGNKKTRLYTREYIKETELFEIKHSSYNILSPNIITSNINVSPIPISPVTISNDVANSNTRIPSGEIAVTPVPNPNIYSKVVNIKLETECIDKLSKNPNFTDQILESIKTNGIILPVYDVPICDNSSNVVKDVTTTVTKNDILNIIGDYNKVFILGVVETTNGAVIFTKNESSILCTDLNGINTIYTDNIVYVTKHEDEESLICTTIYSGDLNFNKNCLIEGLFLYESLDILKVYWVDGINQPRVANISDKALINRINKFGSLSTFPSQFNFIPELNLEEIITVEKLLTGGYFPSGVILYGFTYYNKYLLESKMFYITPINYLCYDKGLSPETTTNCSFKITIDNLDRHFDYIRIYSIIRTSINATPEVKRVVDLDIRNIPKDANTISFIDTGTIGYPIDINYLLFSGGQLLLAGTLILKDNTLFLGNLINKYNTVPKDIKARLIYNVNHITNCLFVGTKEIKVSNLNQYLNYSGNLSGNSSDITSFKVGNTYRIGIVFQYKSGEFSETCYLKDIVIPKSQIVLGESTDLLHFDSSTNKIYVPSIYLNKSIYTDLEDRFISTVKKALLVMVLPTMQDRTILALGVLCPTIYFANSWATDSPSLMSSWLMRPFLLSTNHLPGIYNYSSKDAEISNSMGDGNFELLPDSTEKNITTVIITSLYLNKSYGDFIFISFSLKANNLPVSLRLLYLSDLLGDLYGKAVVNIQTVMVKIDKNNFNTIQSLGTVSEKTEVLSSLAGSWQSVKDNPSKISFKKSAGLSLFVARSLVGKTANDVDLDLLYDYFDFYLGDQEKYLDINDFLRSPTSGTPIALVPVNTAHTVTPITNYNDTLAYLNNRIITFNSPDINDSTYQLFNKKNVTLRVIGNLGKVDSLTTGLFAKYKINKDNDSTLASSKAKGEYLWALDEFKNALVWEDYTEGNDLSDSGLAAFAVYLFHRNVITDSLPTAKENGDNRSTNHSKLKTKIISNTRWFDSNTYYNDPIIYNLVDCKVFNYSEPTQALYTYNNSRIYWGNVDYILNTEDPITPVIGKYTNKHPNLNEYLNLNDAKKYGVTDSNLPVLITYRSTPHLVLDLGKKDSQETDNLITKNGYLLAEILQDIIPYGGLDVDNKHIDSILNSHVWIPIGIPTKLDLDIIGDLGDTYVMRWDCLKTAPLRPDDYNLVIDITSFWVESYINLDGRYDSHRGKQDNLEVTHTNFNIMNEVYSLLNNYTTYNYIDLYYNEMDNKLSSITWSMTKLFGEEVDLYTKIIQSNILDLDGNKGLLLKLLTYNNNIFAIQDKGISLVLYNENYLILTQQGLPIEIANSGKVGGVRYLVDGIGCLNKGSICQTSNGIYFIDNWNKDIFLFNGLELGNLSMNKGMHTWVTNLDTNNVLWEPDDFNNVKTLYSRSTNDIYFVTKKDCIAYNEHLGVFTSFYSYEGTPYMFNIYDSTYLIKNDISDRSIYKMFAGDYNNIYDKSVDYSITTLPSVDGITDKTFSNVSFRADAYRENVYDTNLTFNSIKAWNEYQDTGEVSLVYNNHNSLGNNDLPNTTRATLKKKFRSWHCDIPRNKYDNNNSKITGRRDRIRNPWTYVELKYKHTNTNNDNHKNIIKDITVDYYV